MEARHIELIRVDKNGTKYYEGIVPCDRCGGEGSSEAWRYTGFTCYKCGGSGTMFASWVERTPEYEAKLAERRAARRAKKQAEWEAAHAEEIAAAKLAQQKWAEEEERRRADEEARKAISRYVGTVGEKISVGGTYERTAEIGYHIGWLEQVMFIHIFKDADGNVLVWKTSSNSLPGLERGEPINIKGTVKEHSVYNGEKQTVLTRCKVEYNKPTRKEEEA